MTAPARSGGQANFENRSRASSFGANAELYDETRPSYPDALLDALMARRPTTVLDVGCGTGILGRALQARGASVLGVEPDDKMAEVARGHGLEVELGMFEDWSDNDRRFDLLVSGQAWHWVDPALGAAKASRVVRPKGSVVLAWNDAVLPAGLQSVLGDVYSRHAPGDVAPSVRHRSSEWLRDGGSEAVFASREDFDAPEHATFPWDLVYTGDEWLRQLQTHSDHALMDPASRRALLDAVGQAIEQVGGSFKMHYDCRATSFTRR